MLGEKAKAGLEEDPVITLTVDNFDQITSSADLILVDFYADWLVWAALGLITCVLIDCREESGRLHWLVSQSTALAYINMCNHCQVAAQLYIVISCWLWMLRVGY